MEFQCWRGQDSTIERDQELFSPILLGLNSNFLVDVINPSFRFLFLVSWFNRAVCGAYIPRCVVCLIFPLFRPMYFSLTQRTVQAYLSSEWSTFIRIFGTLLRLDPLIWLVDGLSFSLIHIMLCLFFIFLLLAWYQQPNLFLQKFFQALLVKGKSRSLWRDNKQWGLLFYYSCNFSSKVIFSILELPF